MRLDAARTNFELKTTLASRFLDTAILCLCAQMRYMGVCTQVTDRM
jgi:hypothetical protein